MDKDTRPPIVWSDEAIALIFKPCLQYPRRHDFSVNQKRPSTVHSLEPLARRATWDEPCL